MVYMLYILVFLYVYALYSGRCYMPFMVAYILTLLITVPSVAGQVVGGNSVQCVLD